MLETALTARPALPATRGGGQLGVAARRGCLLRHRCLCHGVVKLTEIWQHHIPPLLLLPLLLQYLLLLILLLIVLLLLLLSRLAQVYDRNLPRPRWLLPLLLRGLLRLRLLLNDGYLPRCLPLPL